MSFETIHVSGLAELERNLNALPEKLAKKDLQAALQAGANLIQKKAIANAQALFHPVAKTGKQKRMAGQLFKGIITKASVYGLGARGARMQVAIGLLKAPALLSAWYGRLLEMGFTAIGRTKRSFFRSLVRKGDAMGTVVAGRPFMRPAFESEKNAALEAIVRKLRGFFTGLPPAKRL